MRCGSAATRARARAAAQCAEVAGIRRRLASRPEDQTPRHAAPAALARNRMGSRASVSGWHGMASWRPYGDLGPAAAGWLAAAAAAAFQGPRRRGAARQAGGVAGRGFPARSPASQPTGVYVTVSGATDLDCGEARGEASTGRFDISKPHAPRPAPRGATRRRAWPRVAKQVKRLCTPARGSPVPARPRPIYDRRPRGLSASSNSSLIRHELRGF